MMMINAQLWSIYIRMQNESNRKEEFRSLVHVCDSSRRDFY